jgi:HD-GYP domain-containing protein (c-di-GMP phosphodiesterase class II)
VVSVPDRELAEVARVFADLADLKTPFTHGHSRGVAALAAGAGEWLGLPPAAVADLEVAGLLHDLGRVAVSDVIWERPTVLSGHEWEQVRLHAYHSERILAGSERRPPWPRWPACTTSGSTAAATTAAAPAPTCRPRPGCWPRPTPTRR